MRMPIEMRAPPDPNPVMYVRPDGASPFLLVSDHAGNAVPSRLGDLGVSAADREDHIAIDIGIFATCNWLSHRLDAAYIAQAYSRLVIDSNRRPGVAASMPTESDGRAIPGNRGIGAAERDWRVRDIFQPYHDAIAAALDARATAERGTVLCAMHSFTRHMNGFARPWDIGVIHGPSTAIADALLGALDGGDFRVGRNEPYGVDFTNDYTIPVHGEGRGLRSVEIEICQDLIREDAGQRRLAATLEAAFRQVADSLNI
jgi:predicted N-formylglutamate amidohydrolase